MFIKEDDQIYRLEEIKTETQIAVVKTFHCFATRLVIVTTPATTVGTPMPVTVKYEDWQGNPLPTETRHIHVEANGQALELEPVNGQAEFDFVADAPGTYRIRAFADFPCAAAEVEVTVK